jgi:membrane protein implicated in regulation of membrane protease activity
MELIFPTAFVSLVMGISALIVAAIALWIPSLSFHLFLWMVLSVGLILVSRRLLPRTPVPTLKDPIEARTLTPIVPDRGGRVLYEGNSWQARCDNEDVTIPAGQRVYVVARRGTTLIVVPENYASATGAGV